jgi:hypothetical protein
MVAGVTSGRGNLRFRKVAVGVLFKERRHGQVPGQPSLRDLTSLVYPTQRCVLGYSQPSLPGLNPGLVGSQADTSATPAWSFALSVGVFAVFGWNSTSVRYVIVVRQEWSENGLQGMGHSPNVRIVTPAPLSAIFAGAKQEICWAEDIFLFLSI